MESTNDFQEILNQEETYADELIEGRVSALLRKKHLQIAVAESMTGGYICQMLTAQPNSSEFFIGGIVCYHPRIKVNYIGVDSKTISNKGLVSEEVAREMAVGIKKRFGTDLGLGVTGVAGPDPHGGKPVGTVWAALASAEGVNARNFVLKGDRNEIRLQAARSALNLVWLHFGEFEL